MRFPLTIAQMCVGLSEDGKDDLPPEELAEGEGVALRLHARTGWELPPNPAKLAAAARVRIVPLRLCAEQLVLSDLAYFPLVCSPRDQGLWMAHALASALLAGRHIEYTDVRAWCLAAQLLVPIWCEGLALVGHPWAPAWLVALRQRAGSREESTQPVSAPRSAPTSQPVSAPASA